MSDIVQVGTVDGRPLYGYALEKPPPVVAEAVPAQFVFDFPDVRCDRKSCDWRHDAEGLPLTEVVAVAREHVDEVHRG